MPCGATSEFYFVLSIFKISNKNLVVDILSFVSLYRKGFIFYVRKVSPKI